MEAKRVLILSSIPPSVGPAILAYEHYKALVNAGHKVDIICREADPRYLEVRGVLSKHKFLRLFQNIILWFRQNIPLRLMKPLSGYSFYHTLDVIPEIPSSWILRAIPENYDVIEIVFWQKMVSYKTIRDLYREKKCPIRLTCVDFSPMTGGCHFTNGCENYKIGCRECPAFCNSIMRKFISSNNKYRKRVIEEVQPYVYMNDYMRCFFFQNSSLFKDYNRLYSSKPWVDTNKYKKISPSGLREKYGIPSNKRFIIFTGSQDLEDERKGFSYLVDSINIIANQLKDKCDEIIVISIGKNGYVISNNTTIDSLDLGYVSEKELLELYNISDVFVCPSIDDAGPMMVLYAIACGTPVVAFEMGFALTVVKQQGTGYCAQLRDSSDLANGIIRILNAPEEHNKLSANCIKYAKENMSEESFVRDYFRDFNKV